MSDEQAPLMHPSARRTTQTAALAAALDIDRQHLRRTMRQQRNTVPASVRQATASAIARHLSRSLLTNRLRIAVYSAFDGEIDLSPIIEHAHRIGCTVYAPRIVNMRTRRMDFIELARHSCRHSGYQRDRHSILEPRNRLHRRIDPRLLDIVLLPLVAFDMHGWRLGFGAGFYDRKLGFLRRGFRHKPLLIGVGYEFQRVPPQTPSAWDVLLDLVVTERGIQRCRR